MTKERTKHGAICVHAQKRFLERVGIELTPRLAKELVWKIKRGKLKHLKKQSNRVSVWLYEHDNREYKLYYDTERHLIITVYPIKSWYREWLGGGLNLIKGGK